MTRLLPLLLLVPSLSFADPLSQAQSQAQAAVSDARLRAELLRCSRALDASARGLVPAASPAAAAKSALSVLAEERVRSGAAKSDEPFASAERLYAELARRSDYKEFAPDLSVAVAEELREAAEEAPDEASLRARLQERLRFPPPDTGPETAKSFFPEDLPLPEFRKLGPIRIFLAKHRWRRPRVYRPLPAADILAGRENVQIGAQVEGVVTNVEGTTFDRDWCFDIGELHMEITPEWRLFHRRIPKPRVGDRVRVRGWTYYDIFHEGERYFEWPKPRQGPEADAKNMWELHPVEDVELLPASAPATASRP